MLDHLWVFYFMYFGMFSMKCRASSDFIWKIFIIRYCNSFPFMQPIIWAYQCCLAMTKIHRCRIVAHHFWASGMSLGCWRTSDTALTWPTIHDSSGSFCYQSSSSSTLRIIVLVCCKGAKLLLPLGWGRLWRAYPSIIITCEIIKWMEGFFVHQNQ